MEQQDRTARLPIPVERLVWQAVDDGSDYDDGVMGWTSHEFDPETGVLVIWFERDDVEAFDPDDDWDSARYVFKLQG